MSDLRTGIVPKTEQETSTVLDLMDEVGKLRSRVTTLTSQLGSARHEARCAQISHEQLNRLIRVFDNAGAKGKGDMEAQAVWLAGEVQRLREQVAALTDRRELDSSHE